jgi:hypothetical protein
MKLIRAELCERLAGLEAAARRANEREFANTLEGLKRIAAIYGATPVVRLAAALERSLLEQPGAGVRDLYLSRLHDAIDCGSGGSEQASEALLASVSVRFCA